jgi:hypothetical protein
MLTHNHTTRRPPTRQALNAYCAQCGLTALQVAILGERTCCDAPSMNPQSAATRRNQSLFPDQNAPAKPQCARTAEELPTPVPPYSTIIITPCDTCGGDGADHGEKDDWYPCNFCGGSGEQAVLRNWLGEAFQLENGTLVNIEPQREHLTALRRYATQVLNVYNSEHAREVA